MYLLKVYGPQFWFCLLTFPPIVSNQICLTTIDTINWLGEAVVTHPLWVQEVPGSTPGSGEGFYVVVFLFCCCCVFSPKIHYLSQYKLKRCSNKECCKQCRYVMFKGTMTKWPVQKPAQGTTQKNPHNIMTQQTPRKHNYIVVFFGFFCFYFLFIDNFLKEFSKKCWATALVRSKFILQCLFI